MGQVVLGETGNQVINKEEYKKELEKKDQRIAFLEAEVTRLKEREMELQT